MHREIPLPSTAAGWKWDGKAELHDAKTLFAYMNGAAELYLAYGFQRLTVRRYEKPGSPPITVELYEMASSEDAFGVFTFERQDDTADIGQGSEFGGGMLRFWKGRYFAAVYAEGNEPAIGDALLALGKTIADAIPERGREPSWSAVLPGRDLGLVERSVRFIRSHVLLNQRFFISHQNILNLDRRTEAFLAQYVRQDERMHLLLIRYTDIKAADEALRGFMKAYLPDAAANGGAQTEDRRWTIARSKGQWLIIVFGAPTQKEAEALVLAAEEKLTPSAEGRGPSFK